MSLNASLASSSAAPAGKSGEQRCWADLAQPRDRAAYADAWLTLQRDRMKGVLQAQVIMAPEDGSDTFETVASWPTDGPVNPSLVEAAHVAFEDGRPMVVDLDGGKEDGTRRVGSSVAMLFPLTVYGETAVVVAMELARRSENELQAAMRQLQWGAAWLELFFHRAQANLDTGTIDRLTLLLELLSVAVEHASFSRASLALVTELAAHLDCDRVSYGFLKAGRMRVAALSHSGQFGRQMNLISAIGRAMDEAFDQGETVQYPQGEGERSLVNRCHAALARRHGANRVLTVSCRIGRRAGLCLTLERSSGDVFDRQTVDLCETLISIAGPVLEGRRLENRNIVSKIGSSIGAGLAALLGRGHLVLKTASILVAAVAVFLALAKGDFRVTADASIEGAVQRAVVAPFDGYVETALARAGDLVEAGELIGTLDNRDLTLSLAELTSRRSQELVRYREALAAHDRAQVNVFRAQVQQTEASIALAESQLKRAELRAPFDGLIVSGDLTQQLGAPVARGDVLLEVSPANRFRIAILVDERDIDHVRLGQRVVMVVAAIPDERFDLEVKKITPVSVAMEGRNFFRVEALYEDASERLRPGMRAVAKIEVDRRLLAWIWGRKLLDWTELNAWRWIP